MRKLKPNCDILMRELRKRACRQIEIAYDILVAHGETITFSAPGEHGVDMHWDNCIQMGAATIRRDANGCMRMHFFNNYWSDILVSSDISVLASAADYFLERAYKLAD